MNKSRPASTSGSSAASNAAANNKKKKVEDYDFGDVLGEGAFGAVSDCFFGFFRFGPPCARCATRASAPVAVRATQSHAGPTQGALCSRRRKCEFLVDW